VNTEGAEVTSAGRAFQTRVPATEKVRRPTVGSLTAGTHRSSEVKDRSLCHVRFVSADECLRIRPKSLIRRNAQPKVRRNWPVCNPRTTPAWPGVHWTSTIQTSSYNIARRRHRLCCWRHTNDVTGFIYLYCSSNGKNSTSIVHELL